MLKKYIILLVLISSVMINADTISISANKTTVTADNSDSIYFTVRVTDDSVVVPLSRNFIITQTNNAFGNFTTDSGVTDANSDGTAAFYFVTNLITGINTITAALTSNTTTLYTTIDITINARTPDTIYRDIEPNIPLFSGDTTLYSFYALSSDGNLVLYDTATLSTENDADIIISDTEINTGSTGYANTVLTLFDTSEKAVVKITIGGVSKYDTLWVWEDANGIKDKTSPVILTFFENTAGSFKDYEYVPIQPTFNFTIVDTPVGIDLSSLKVYIDNSLVDNTDTDIIVTVYDTTVGFAVNPNTYTDYPETVVIKITSSNEYSAGLHNFKLMLTDHAGNSPLQFSRYFYTEKTLTITNVINYPNPVNPEVEFINFTYVLSLAVQETVIKIFDLNGKLLKTINGTNILGYNSVSWNGIDDNNNNLKNGIYFYRIISKINNSINKSEIGKIAILR